MKKFKKEPAPDKENLDEQIIEAEEELENEEQEAEQSAPE